LKSENAKIKQRNVSEERQHELKNKVQESIELVEQAVEEKNKV